MEANIDIAALIKSLNAKNLVFTVTSGRSGTRLLALLLRESLGVDAEHEPVPRVNFVLRSIIEAPDVASAWLAYEKLPAIAARASGPVYVETSHLFCKAFIEPMLDLGLRPRFIMLTRPAQEVACSLFKLNVIPHRTAAGRLVLLAPTDPGVLPLPNWEKMTDYQLCYWYVREIERRQSAYDRLFKERGLGVYWIDIHRLTDWTCFTALGDFVGGRHGFIPDRHSFDTIVACDQHPRAAVGNGRPDRPLPTDLAAEERLVEEAIRR